MRARWQYHFLKWLLLAMAQLCLTAGRLFGQEAAPPKCTDPKKTPSEVRIATGSAGGSYLRMGKIIGKLVPDLNLVPCTTEGSLDNLLLLSQGFVEYAIVQSDLAHIGWSEEPAPEYAADKWGAIDFHRVKLVRWLYSEKLQILAGAHSYVNSVNDLKNKRVWLGPSGSGTYATASEVLRAAGIDPSEINDPAQEISSYRAANEALVHGGVDVIIRTTPVPIDYHQEPDLDSLATLSGVFKNDPEVHLVGLEKPIIDRLARNPSYLETPLYRETYPNQEGGILTIGTEAMIVTGRGRSVQEKEEVRQLSDGLDEKRAQIQDEINIELDLLGKRLDPHVGKEKEWLNSIVHPAVRERLTKNWKELYTEGALGVLILVVLFWLPLRSRRFLNGLGGAAKYLVTGGMLLSACATFGFVLWVIERRFSLDFQNPLSAARSLLVYFAHGMKAENLMTEDGQLVALVALAVIASLVHWLHAEALSDTVNRWADRLRVRLHRWAGVLSPAAAPRVILNWNERAEERVGAWIKENPSAASKFIVVAPRRPDTSALPNLAADVWRPGDPKSTECLHGAHTVDASSVLICSAWRRTDLSDRRTSVDPELADSYTIRAIQAIRALCARNKTPRSVLIEAEILLEKNLREAELAGGQHTKIILAPFVSPGNAKNAPPWASTTAAVAN